MIQEKCFSCLRHGDLAVCVRGNPPDYYPLTYTLEEALEDWCDHLGHEFVKILGCFSSNNLSDYKSGKFSYKLASTSETFIQQGKIVTLDVFADVGDSWSW